MDWPSYAYRGKVPPSPTMPGSILLVPRSISPSTQQFYYDSARIARNNAVPDYNYNPPVTETQGPTRRTFAGSGADSTAGATPTLRRVFERFSPPRNRSPTGTWSRPLLSDPVAEAYRDAEEIMRRQSGRRLASADAGTPDGRLRPVTEVRPIPSSSPGSRLAQARRFSVFANGSSSAPPPRRAPEPPTVRLPPPERLPSPGAKAHDARAPRRTQEAKSPKATTRSTLAMRTATPMYTAPKPPTLKPIAKDVEAPVNEISLKSSVLQPNPRPLRTSSPLGRLASKGDLRAVAAKKPAGVPKKPAKPKASSPIQAAAASSATISSAGSTVTSPAPAAPRGPHPDGPPGQKLVFSAEKAVDIPVPLLESPSPLVREAFHIQDSRATDELSDVSSADLDDYNFCSDPPTPKMKRPAAVPPLPMLAF